LAVQADSESLRPHAESQEEDHAKPAVEYLEQGHGVGEVPHGVLVIGEPAQAAVVPQQTHQGRGEVETLDLIRQVHDCLFVVALDSHDIEDNDDGESEIQDETDGVVVEELLNGDIFPGYEAVGMGAE